MTHQKPSPELQARIDDWAERMTAACVTAGCIHPSIRIYITGTIYSPNDLVLMLAFGDGVAAAGIGRAELEPLFLAMRECVALHRDYCEEIRHGKRN